MVAYFHISPDGEARHCVGLERGGRCKFGQSEESHAHTAEEAYEHEYDDRKVFDSQSREKILKNLNTVASDMEDLSYVQQTDYDNDTLRRAAGEIFDISKKFEIEGKKSPKNKIDNATRVDELHDLRKKFLKFSDETTANKKTSDAWLYASERLGEHIAIISPVD